MRRLIIGGWLALGGCDLAFDLTRPSACPVALECPLGGNDEDGDGLLDNCDPCPQIADPTPADSDGDQFGDACDPAPTTPAACRIRRFFGMKTADGWDPATTVGWGFDGEVQFKDGGLGRLESIERVPRGRITAHVFDGGAPMVDDAIAGVVGFGEGDHAYACAINPAFGGAVGKLVLLELVAAVPIVRAQGADPSFAVTPGLSHQVSLSITVDGMLECRSMRNTTVESVIEAMPSGDIPDASTFGLVSQRDGAYVTWLDVIPE